MAHSLSPLPRRFARFVAVLLTLAPVGACGDDVGEGPVSLDPGQSAKRLISAHCGYGTLLVDVNGMVWSTDEIPVNEAGVPIEPTWPTDQNIVVELELVNEQTLLVRAADSDIGHIYRPDPSPPGCM